jgi:methylmalonyl-CoA mutase, N-terminal domain
MTDDFISPSGIPIRELYEAADGVPAQVGRPGEPPYTRGIHSSMYRGRPWTMRQYAGFGSAQATNERFKFLLEAGQTGLSVAFDLPSQIGYDSDDEMAEGEVGRVGVPIDTIVDMENVFEDIPLGAISTSFTINGTAAIMLAMYLVVAERQGVSFESVTGTIQNDILKEYVARGTWIFPPEPSLRLIVDTIQFCADHVPRFNPISIAGAHFRDSGASAVQELAFTLADGITYVERCRDRGLDLDLIGRRLSFFFYTHMDFFEEVAKYRAGRRMWHKIMTERFGVSDPRAAMFRVGVVCGGSSLTIEQAQNNIVRVAYEAMASVLGGVQSMFTAAWDEASTLPSESTAELALRTQQLLALETGVTATVDPLGGSYYVEELTDTFESLTFALIDQIERQGGMVACIENGWVQREIATRAYREQRAIEEGSRRILGVNVHKAEHETADPAYFEVSEEDVTAQLDRLASIRSSRDASRVAAALSALEQAARSEANMMHALLDCVREYCTVGEMTQTMRNVFGEFRQPPAF